MSRGRILAILGVLLFIAAGITVWAFHDVLVGTGLFFIAWGVWFAAVVWK